MEDKKEFIEYLKEERRQMARVASHYTVDSHRILRTQIDSLLIAYDEAVERLSLFDVSGSLPFPVAILDGLKVDVKFKDGGLIIKKSNCC